MEIKQDHVVLNQAQDQAQERLLQKREELKVTDSHTLSTSKDEEVGDIIARLRASSAGRLGIKDDVLVYQEPDAVIWRRNKIPERYLSSTFENFEGNEALIKTVKLYLEAGDDILLMGTTGTGKSHICVACLKEIRSEWSRFATVPELLLEIRSTFRDLEGKESEQDIINRYCNYGVLVLDDLGAEKSSDYSITTLYLIIDRRIRNCKRTIISTNLSLEEIEKNLDARIASRLVGMKTVKINMPDFRKKRNKR